MKRVFNSATGFSLLEAVLAIGLFSLCLLAAVQAAGLMYRTSRIARDFDAALYLAESKMEEMLSLGYDDIVDGDEPDAGSRVAGGTSVFRRRVTVHEQTAPLCKRVFVTVSWRDPDLHRVELASIVSP